MECVVFIFIGIFSSIWGCDWGVEEEYVNVDCRCYNEYVVNYGVMVFVVFCLFVKVKKIVECMSVVCVFSCIFIS